MGERWRVCGRWRGTEGVGVGCGVRILWKKKSRYAQSAWQSVTLRLCPCSRKGKGERAAGCGASSLCPSLELAVPDSSSSSSSPLYSVLSSRCQEVAQCLFCFLLKVCVILHVFLFVCLFVFVLKNWRSRLVVRKFQVALCVSSCRQSCDCLI